MGEFIWGMNRVVMSICSNIGKKKFNSFLNKFFFTNMLFSSFLILAQSTSLSMPTISSPSMPTITSPALNSSTNSTSNESKSSTSSTSSTSSASSAISSAAASSSILQNLTASDLTSLTDSSGISSLTSLLGLTNNSSSTLNSLSSVSNLTSSTASNALLEKILEQLTLLVAAQNANSTNSSTTNTSSTDNATQASLKTENNNSLERLLRLRANGYNLLDSCSTIYFSKPEENGSFLLTGDRKYLSNGTYLNETFYFLFQNTENTNTYNVSATIMQDRKNEFSFLYQASQLSPLIATRTGNLITLNINKESFSFEMLIQLGENN